MILVREWLRIFQQRQGRQLEIGETFRIGRLRLLADDSTSDGRHTVRQVRGQAGNCLVVMLNGNRLIFRRAGFGGATGWETAALGFSKATWGLAVVHAAHHWHAGPVPWAFYSRVAASVAARPAAGHKRNL